MSLDVILSLLDQLADPLDWLVRLVNIAGFAIGIIALSRRRRRRIVASFFGGKVVKIWIGTRNIKGRVVYDAADLAAAQSLEQFLARFEVKVNYGEISEDSVPLMGHGQIVIGGPKLSTHIAAKIKEDPNIEFLNRSGEWLLYDKVDRAEYPASDDSDPSSQDYGYLARIPLSTSSGRSFLSIAGVHAPGTAIVVEHICDFQVVNRLARQYGRGSFSGIITGTHRLRPLLVLSTDEVAMRRWFRSRRSKSVGVGNE